MHVVSRCLQELFEDGGTLFSRRFVRLSVGAAVLSFLTACAAAPVEEEVSIAYPPEPETPRYYYESTITGSGDVVEDSAGERFKRFATGETARGQGFPKPFGVVAMNGRIYVGDTVARHVAALDFPGKRFFQFGDSGLGRLAKPLGMAADASGRVYVCDGTSKRILVYDPDGQYLKALGGEEMLERPSGVAVNADGSRVYVVDTGGVRSRNHRVRVFGADGNHLFDIGTRGAGPREFNLPLAAAVGPDGRLYVLDSGNFRVQVFTPDGDFLFQFGSAGRTPGHFSHPKSIAVDREGKIFVSDSGFANVQIFDGQGRILMFMGNRSDRGGPGEFILPAGVSVDVDGRVYMVDQFFRKIDVFRPAGLPEDTPKGQSPAAVTASSTVGVGMDSGPVMTGAN
ncbi:MAG TPA: 6-bladed beta-propeller [Chromatiales bacterium]|nr:6-bladed beta-propeller [Chromatiales bacterium]